MLLTDQQRVKLCDFGISAVLPSPGFSDSQSSKGVDMYSGTAQYMAPECFHSLQRETNTATMLDDTIAAESLMQVCFCRFLNKYVRRHTLSRHRSVCLKMFPLFFFFTFLADCIIWEGGYFCIWLPLVGSVYWSSNMGWCASLRHSKKCRIRGPRRRSSSGFRLR